MHPQEHQENAHKEQPVAALQHTTTNQKQCRKSAESRHNTEGLVQDLRHMDRFGSSVIVCNTHHVAHRCNRKR